MLGQIFFIPRMFGEQALGGLTSAINWAEPTFREIFARHKDLVGKLNDPD